MLQMFTKMTISSTACHLFTTSC